MSGRRLLLGLDSATDHLALALVEAPAGGGREPGAVVARFAERVGREHAARIIGELARLLEEAGAERADVAAIGVGVGPGSYTGVRVGIATARALGRAWDVPVSGASTLLALFGDELPEGGRGLALLDARRDNVYALLAEHSAGSGLRTLEGPLKLARAELDERFPGVPRFEGAPDAAVLARLGPSGGALDAYYL